MSLEVSTTVPAADLRYPIGRFDRNAPITADALNAAISVLAETPSELRAALDGLTGAQLDTPYREGGWTVRQLVHHIADSHMNAVIRHKLGLTEASPTIKPYDENAWAALCDSAAPVEGSVALLTNLHARWVMLLRSMTDEDWAREYVHPERGPLRLDLATLLYAWHSRHHVAHITALRRREGWA